ncbi:hypothetical protein EDB92DRAFT_1880889 [Lactarius akahatsu]|uniref:Uncharacterized protein n=1 Tax=Lactarius akahatsu TaxID=416441 RepID=A0AAD4LAB6_9AGAM|nr:hypothetical protein EDB92DRAFT_1887641 [Lactarius akahatsu]KAH8986144.1 hypothetical protein EDB92DRAFT_1880889 [Lactarius akahatsu]
MFSMVLEAASKFDVQDTSPELRQDFCALWNQIVLKAQIVDNSKITLYILRPIHSTYIALHRNTGSAPTRFSASTDNEDHILKEPTVYPVCNVAGHLHDDSASTGLARTALRDSAALAPASLAGTDAPSSVPALHLGDETLTNVPPLDNDSFHPAHQTAIETLRIPPSPLDPVTARVIQGEIDTSATTIPSTLEPSVSTLPPTSSASTSPPGATSFQNIADRCTSSDVLDVPLLPSPAPVLESILPTGSRSSLLAPAAPDPPRLRLVIAPDPGAAREAENSVEATLHKESGALDTPSTIQEQIHIVAALDLPPPSPSPPSVTDVAIAGSSRRSLGAEHTGDCPPRPFRGQYDIV